MSESDKEPCPTCGEMFQSGRGVSSHHVQVHGESIAGVEYECKNCGEQFRARDREYKTYCSRKCMAQDYSEREDVGGIVENYEHRSGQEHPNWVLKKEFDCDFCGEVFIDYNYKKRQYCSINCKNKDGREERKCYNCETAFSVKKSIEKKFCCYECSVEDKKGREEHKWETVECLNCSESFEALINYSRKYCSIECRSEHLSGENSPQWRGGSNAYYGKTFTKQIKEEVREMTDRKCYKCSIDEEELNRRLDVHHIIPFRIFGIENHKEANRKDNLVALCRQCHMKVDFGDLEI
jgi:hypothetical protein